MTGLIILGVLALIIILLLCLRISVQADFGGEVHVIVRIGPVKLQLLPKPEKKQQGKRTVKKPSDSGEKTEKRKRKKTDIHLTAADIRGALSAVWRGVQCALRRKGHHIRIDPMRLSIVFGHENPVNTAQWYGWANAAVWTVMPRLEELTQLPDPRIHMEMDFSAVKTEVSGSVGVRCSVGGLLAVGFGAAVPLLRFAIPFLKRQKAMRKTAAKQAAQESSASDHAA